MFLDATVTESEGREFAKSIGASFHSISCLQGCGIQEMVQEIGEKYLEVKQLLGEEEPVNGIEINKKDITIEKKKPLCSWFS